MSTLTLRRMITVVTFGLICAVAASGQTPQVTSWEGVQSYVALGQKLDVVTVADPTRRQTCRVRSIDVYEITCTHGGHPTIFRASDVAALIEPGVHTNHFFGFMAASVGSIMAAALFAVMCQVCTVVAAVAGVGFFIAAPMSAIHWRRAAGERLLFLAPRQKLQVSLR